MNQSTLDESVCPCQTIQYNPPKKKKNITMHIRNIYADEELDEF